MAIFEITVAGFVMILEGGGNLPIMQEAGWSLVLFADVR